MLTDQKWFSESFSYNHLIQHQPSEIQWFFFGIKTCLSKKTRQLHRQVQEPITNILCPSTTYIFDVLYYLLNQVNSAWALNRTPNQWIDLGIHAGACITHPETCSAGGAISLWVNILMHTPFYDGIVSAGSNIGVTKKTASKIFGYENIRYDQILLT